jgi:hypothetical protein
MRVDMVSYTSTECMTFLFDGLGELSRCEVTGTGVRVEMSHRNDVQPSRCVLSELTLETTQER